MKVILNAILPLVAALFSVTATGHHSTFAIFDAGAFIEFEAKVIEVSWRNPHVNYIVERTEASGEITIWKLESSSAGGLVRAGLNPETIKVGDLIRVGGQPPLTSKKEMYLTNALLPTGQELLLRGSRTKPRWNDSALGIQPSVRATEGDTSRPELGIFRIWTYTRASPILFPEDSDPDFDVTGGHYPLTTAALESVQQFDRIKNDTTKSCTPKGMPTIMEQPYPMEFVDEGNIILLNIEEYDAVRKIHMSEATTVDNVSPSPFGFSRGRWDGNTLVVTTQALNWSWFAQAGIPQSEDSVLVERFNVTLAGSRLDYELIVTDPENFKEPVRAEKYWLYDSKTEFLPYECLEYGDIK